MQHWTVKLVNHTQAGHFNPNHPCMKNGDF